MEDRMKRIAWALFAGILMATPALAGEKERTFSLAVKPGSRLTIDAGAGFLKVEGREGQTTVEVKARVVVEGVRDRELEDFISDKVELYLRQDGDGAKLKAVVRNRSWFSFGREAYIDLTVTVPKTLNLSIDDGSGSLEVRSLQGNVDINDGSGSMIVERIQGNLRIEDGSGEIEVREVTGDVQVDDGSGSMSMKQIGGSLTIDDGSGHISIDGVEKDVHLRSTGSGGETLRNIKGRVIRR